MPTMTEEEFDARVADTARKIFIACFSDPNVVTPNIACCLDAARDAEMTLLGYTSTKLVSPKKSV